MNSLPVVPDLDVFEDPPQRLFPCFELFQIDELSFNNAVKRFDARMIKAVAFATHATNHLVFSQLFLVVTRGILASHGPNDAALVLLVSGVCRPAPAL